MYLLTTLLALTLQQAPQNQFGTIEGIVARSGSAGTPIAGAHVKVSERPQMPVNPSPFTRETTTDESGRFRVADVPAGAYQIEIAHENFGFRRSGLFNEATFTDHLTVIAGQVVQVSEILAVPAGAIRGHVLDADGKGVPGVPVEILRMSTDGTGRRIWSVMSGRVFTDRDGAFRKSLYGSGDYYVRAVLESGPARVDVYHPATMEGGKAAPVALSEGSEAVADVRIGSAVIAAESFQIAGKVTLPPVDAGAPFIALVLTRLDPGGPVDSSAYLRTSTRANDGVGEFQFRDVRPGNYELAASSSINGSSFSGKTLVDVRDTDMDGVEVVVHPPFEVKGRMLFDGEPQELRLSRRIAASAVPGTEVRLNLIPKDPMSRGIGRPYNPIIDSAGTGFSFQDVPEGEYLLNAYLETAGELSNGPLYISDIRASGRSVIDSGIRVGLDPIDALEVIIGTKGGSIEGQVVGNSSNQAATLVVLPEPSHRNNRSLFRTTPLSPDGRFQILGLAPGTYSVFAVPSQIGNLTRYESRALSVTVQMEKTTGSLQVPFLPQ